MTRLSSFQEYCDLHEVTLGGGQRIDPKRFEKDLVRAVNGVTGYSHFQSRSAEVLAHKVATSLRGLGIQGTATLLSGSSPISNLSELYRRYGVRNGEPKADLRIDTRRCSVKYAKNAPLATAEANETRAVFAAACQHHPEYEQLVVRQFLPLIEQTMTAQMFQKLRAAYDTTSPTAFQTMLSRVLGLHSTQKVASAKERTAFQQFLAQTGVLVPIRAQLSTFLQAPTTKRAVFREFASGEYRFSRPDLSATHMLLWDESGRVSCTPIRGYIDAHLENFTYSIRSAHQAAALRVDVREVKALSADLLAHCDAWAAREVTHLPLTESMMGTLWSQFVDVVKQVLAVIVQIFQEGIDTVLSVFGYEVDGLSWTPTF